MKYYAVIDTNVLVSAMLKWDSIPGSVLELALDGPIIPILNDAIMTEYREVLSRPKFHLTTDIVDDILAAMEAQGFFVAPEAIPIDLPDPKDQVFYEVVMEQRKTEDAYLVTGNIRHFPVEPFIVTPREMIEIILSDKTI
ncbi:putative toxin-antitoxin system toxin component, PIN family [Acutalibacter muris]|uniref:putative toxin-antitoxin system toxin component, PIN family n=1 Tax=Acutalibacter muris TaxID=1796620 RepID=UPI00272E0187|nr:putative toxin-antitoxin system toxin component, PIN family [Acutalibacter muris]